jgi:GntR family transcriptional regulator/MocR family aminotransferase
MYLALDGNGPLHAQLTRAVKGAILDGRYGVGSRLPPSRALGRELGLSRNTVMTAYEQLRAEGFVTGRVGSGSYVTQPLQVATVVQAGAESVPAQSAFARRARLVHDGANVPGRALPGGRYCFQYGLPMVNPALASLWARALAHAAAYTPPNYPATQGLPALRSAICDYLARRRGIVADPDDVVVVSGTQQAVSLCLKVLMDEGEDAVLAEPHYFAVRELVQMHGARITAVPADEQGLCCDLLPLRPPKLVFVTPSHQFPGGSVLSLARRMELLRYAGRHGSWIVEDDYDGEFRYDGRPLAALRSLDREDRVIYVGSFSKTMFPSLRLGYMVVPRALRGDFVTAKWAQDFGSSAIEQAALAAFIADGGFERHLRRSARTLAERRDALIQGLREQGKGRLRIADSRAGMHLVAWLQDRGAADVERLLEIGARSGLGLHSILPYYQSPPDRCGLLFGYASMSVTELREAVLVFGGCLDQFYRETSAAGEDGKQQRRRQPRAIGRTVRKSGQRPGVVRA